jgi:hypothetical protein
VTSLQGGEAKEEEIEQPEESPAPAPESAVSQEATAPEVQVNGTPAEVCLISLILPDIAS